MKRALGWVIGTIFAIVLLAQLAILVANLTTRHRAERLLASLHSLEVGKSTFEDTQPTLAAYGAKKMFSGNCSSPAVGYSIYVGNNTIAYLGSNYPLLLRMGVRPWGVSATLSFADGRLCEFRYIASTLLARGQLPWKDSNLASAQAIEIRAQTAVEAANVESTLKAENYEIRYFDTLLRAFPFSGRTLGLQVNVTSNTAPSEFARALSFDLSCFTSLRGCRTFCQIMPLVSQDALHRHQTEGLPFPEDEIEFPGCTAVYRPMR